MKSLTKNEAIAKMLEKMAADHLESANTYERLAGNASSDADAEMYKRHGERMTAKWIVVMDVRSKLETIDQLFD